MSVVRGSIHGMNDAAPWVWAKSGVDDRKAVVDWLPLWRHLADSAEIAGLLWDEWLSPQARRVVVDAVGDEGSARALVRFLAGVHDVGKATPVFQSKVPVLAEQLSAHGLSLGIDVSTEDRRRLPHGLAGQVLLEQHLMDRGWGRKAARQLGAVIGGHHGIPPELSEVEAAAARPALLGGGLWREVQTRLISDAEGRTEVNLERLRERALRQPAAVLATGLVIVADWLASNAALCALVPIGRQPVNEPHRGRNAWERIRLPRPWIAVETCIDADRLFRERFVFGGEPAPARPVQRAALDAARECDVPGVLVIEAPMGEGKTEAALLAVETLAARSGASGCFVALPTQATTNAMFARVLDDWLPRLPDGASEGRRHTVALAHGRALLDPRFRALRDQRSSGIHQDDGQVGIGGVPTDQQTVDAYVHWWMLNRKKSPLADFAVGTIDQLLFAALQARHLALRHLGLAGKVVVIDEVHAYDAYMSVYLDRVLEWLGAYGVSVVMLSATLPAAARERLMEAYRKGIAVMTAPPALSNESIMPTWDLGETPSGPPPLTPRMSSMATPPYPTVTSLSGGDLTTLAVAGSARNTSVDLELLHDGADRLSRLLRDALSEGGCALVVRNTVKRAQDTFDQLAEVFAPEEVSLHHSRYLASDRARNDAWLTGAFGPPGKGPRPECHVVVATQVAEQSLDVDFDLLVTDLAPIDLLLQRIGRLHRHERLRPQRLRRPRCAVVAEDWSSVPPRFVPGAQAVYDRFTLLQSARLVEDRAKNARPLMLPDDIAGLVAEAYGPVLPDQEPWHHLVAEARAGWERNRLVVEARARTFRLAAPEADMSCLNGWLGRTVGEADDSVQGLAQVRDSDDSIEVLVLVHDRDGVVVLPGWLPETRAGETLPLDSEPDADLARAIAGCAVRLPAALCRGSRGDALLGALGRGFLLAWQRVPELRGQLLLVLDDDGEGGASATLAGVRLRYHPATGLAVSVTDRVPKEVS